MQVGSHNFIFGDQKTMTYHLIKVYSAYIYMHGYYNLELMKLIMKLNILPMHAVVHSNVLNTLSCWITWNTLSVTAV